METKFDPALREKALRARYGAAMPAAGPWNDALERLLAHRSVRAFTDEPLADGTVETLVAAAQSAATSSNMQLWSVIAVTDKATQALLGEVAHHQKHVAQAPLVLVFLADLSRASRLGKREGVRLEGLEFLESFLVAAMDAAIAAQNAVVAAESLGLGTVYLGAIRNDPELVARALKLPFGAMAVVGLVVGHIADPGTVKPRLPQEAVLHRDAYQLPDDAALLAQYDRELAAFWTGQGRPAATWTEAVKARLGTREAMHGRHTLHDVLNRMGFHLR